MSTSEHKRSPLTLNGLEIASAILVGAIAWFAFRSYLQSARPFPCGSSVNDSLTCGWTTEKAWQELGSPLFSSYAALVVPFLVIAAVGLIRSLRQDVLHFSVLGNLAIASPIVIFLGFFVFGVFDLYCFPTGVVLASVASILSREAKNNKWDWVSLPFNLTWLVLFGSFVGKMLQLYGD